LISSVRLAGTQSILHHVPLPSTIPSTVSSLPGASTVLHPLLLHHAVLIAHASLKTVHLRLHPLPLWQAALIVESRLIIAEAVPTPGLLQEAVLEPSATVPVTVLVPHLLLLHTLVIVAVRAERLPSSHSPLPAATASRRFSCGEAQAYDSNNTDC
jgi:hypothetical protein